MKLLSGTVTIAVAGTRQRFASQAQEAIYLIVFRARAGNVSRFYLGGSGVSASAGLEFDPGTSLTLEFPQGREAALSDFYGDASSSGDSMDYLASAR